jgi:hypothetical protein
VNGRIASFMVLLAACDVGSGGTGAPKPLFAAAPATAGPKDLGREVPTIGAGPGAASGGPGTAAGKPDADRPDTHPASRESRGAGARRSPCPGGFSVETCIAGGMPERTPDGRIVPNVGCMHTCSARPPTGGPAVRCARTGPRAYRCSGAAP